MSETEGNPREERHNTSLMDPKEENAVVKRKIAVVEQENGIFVEALKRHTEEREELRRNFTILAAKYLSDKGIDIWDTARVRQELLGAGLDRSFLDILWGFQFQSSNGG